MVKINKMVCLEEDTLQKLKQETNASALIQSLLENHYKNKENTEQRKNLLDEELEELMEKKKQIEEKLQEEEEEKIKRIEENKNLEEEQKAKEKEQIRAERNNPERKRRIEALKAWASNPKNKSQKGKENDE